MDKTVYAPWDEETVKALNAYQKSGWHPYTCRAEDRTEGDHADYQALVGGDFGELVATKDGWICPVCGYTQNWAMQEMVDVGKEGKLDKYRVLAYTWKEKGRQLHGLGLIEIGKTLKECAAELEAVNKTI